MYGFVDDTKLEDCSVIKEEGIKNPSLESNKNKGTELIIALIIQHETINVNRLIKRQPQYDGDNTVRFRT